jgi:hypothetical protein
MKLWLKHFGSVCRREGSFILDAEPFSGFPVHVYLGLILSKIVFSNTPVVFPWGLKYMALAPV